MDTQPRVLLATLAHELGRPPLTMRTWIRYDDGGAHNAAFDPITGTVTAEEAVRLRARAATAKRIHRPAGFYAQKAATADPKIVHHALVETAVLSEKARTLAGLLNMSEKAFIDHAVSAYIKTLSEQFAKA